MFTPRISLDQWRSPNAVVETGGYSQAAALLNRSQSSVSYHISRLQDLLGVEVFKIVGRKARLTEHGEVLYRRSQQLLRTAREWNLEVYPDRQAMPSSRRASKRGDEMLVRAKDTSASLPLRDTLYRQARRYYDFGGFDDASAAAAAAHATIEPELQAERDRQQEALDRATANLKRDAESAQQGVKDMIKTDSEKRAFENEADAMEKELDF